MSEIWSDEEVARRLAERFKGVNQAKFARDHGLKGGASMLSQHINGRRPLNLEAANVYAKGFGVTLEEISPKIAESVRSSLPVLPKASSIQEIPIANALPVVLDALAKAPARAELRTLLPLLIDSDAQAYRQRLAELLVASKKQPMPSVETKDFAGKPENMFVKPKQNA